MAAHTTSARTVSVVHCGAATACPERAGEAAIAADSAGWTVPTLLLYSKIDKLVDWRACARFAQEVPAGLLEAHVYDDLAHDLLNEPKWRLPIGALTDWLARRFG